MSAHAFSAQLRLSRPNWRRALSALLAIAAMLVGLFAMHSMVGTGSHHEVGDTAVTAAAAPHGHVGDAGLMGAAAAHHDDPVLSVACDEACQMGCLVVGLICTLGLLAVLIAFHLPPVARRIMAAQIFSRRLVNAALATAAMPRPPSLVALSISRT
jgi:hypothetical protein